MTPSDDTNRAVERAAWLASVAAALDEAQRLATSFADLGPERPEAVALRLRIAAIRREVELTQRAPHPPPRDDPPLR